MTPRRYQLAGAEYVLSRDHAMLGDAPGLGKSCEALLVDNAIESGRTLIVCPASLRLNWEREVWMWSMVPNVRTYTVLRAADGVSPQADFVIISYDLLRNPDIMRALLVLRWDHLILDEAHYLKDPRGNRRTEAVDLLVKVVGRVTMATGTPLPNQPVEVYRAIRLLNWEAINCCSLETFREFYYEEGEGFIRGPYLTEDDDGNPVWKTGLHYSTHVRNVPRRMDDLRLRLRTYLMVRRLKRDVMPELPDKQWHVFPLATTPGMRRAMKHPGWVEAEHLYEMNPAAFDRGIPVDGAISTARRLLGEEKAKSVANYVEELFLEGTRKVIVAAWHHNVLDVLRERLSHLGLVYMDGNTAPKRKQAAVDQFQADVDIGVILGQMKPLGEGWTLTAAQDVVLAEPDWVPGRNDQLLDRVHRFGQEGDKLIGHVPVVPNSLDERVMGTAIVKDASIHEALDVRD
jgi:SNF2 family DNA or RNA helicase|tara:strand:- start:3863 stop:5239 length:1377 start_codon:yes stop_codon:yes gene_type:complete